MSDITLVLLAAGSGKRFNDRIKKQWLRSDETPLWLLTLQRLTNMYPFSDVRVVASPSDSELMKHFTSYPIVQGGQTRQESLIKGLETVRTPFVLVHDAARVCVPETLVRTLIARKNEADIIIPSLKPVDTCYFEGKPIEREKVRLVQTPQLSRLNILKQALQTQTTFTDDSSAVAAIGGKLLFVEGAEENIKLTYREDLDALKCIEAASSRLTVGFGIDTHPFTEGKALKLGGVELPYTKGFKAHSDGDVAIHALIDALLGAAGLGDIGTFFPDTDERYKGCDSMTLLRETNKLINAIGLEIRHIDMTIVAEAPKIAPYKTQMRYRLCETLQIEPFHVNIKATTSEKLGFIGREEGVTVHAVATVGYRSHAYIKGVL